MDYWFFSLLDPFGILRKYIVRPILHIFESHYAGYRERTASQVDNVRDLLIRLCVILFVVACVFWTAIFFYVTFYYVYMPPIAHMRSVHMQFKTCDSNDKSPSCVFPTAHVTLTRQHQLLMVGQPYKVVVNIELPESEENRNVGMFMVCAEMRDKGQNLRGHSCRSAMLRYMSPLLRNISTWVLSPLLILGVREEMQTLSIELFNDYLDDKSNPVTNIFVEIQNASLQFYGVNLQVMAQFSGLRYFMFHWPLLSAVIGITTNLILVLMVLLLSWYHLSGSKWLGERKENGNSEEREKLKKQKRDHLMASGDESGSQSRRGSNQPELIEEVQGNVEVGAGDGGGTRRRIVASSTGSTDC